MKFTNFVLASLAVLFTSALALPVGDITDLGAREPIDTRSYFDDLEERDFDDEELGIYARGNKPASSSTKELEAWCRNECKEGGFTPGTKLFTVCMQTCCTFFFPSRLTHYQ